jgi:hypothetical protein
MMSKGIPVCVCGTLVTDRGKQRQQTCEVCTPTGESTGLDRIARELTAEVQKITAFDPLTSTQFNNYSIWRGKMLDSILTAFEEVRIEAKEEVQDSWVEAIDNLPEQESDIAKKLVDMTVYAHAQEDKVKQQAEQIDSLANFIMANVDGEPSQSEGAVECAIRIIKQQAEREKQFNAMAACIVDTNKDYVAYEGHGFSPEDFGLTVGRYDNHSGEQYKMNPHIIEAAKKHEEDKE